MGGKKKTKRLGGRMSELVVEHLDKDGFYIPTHLCSAKKGFCKEEYKYPSKKIWKKFNKKLDIFLAVVLPEKKSGESSYSKKQMAGIKTAILDFYNKLYDAMWDNYYTGAVSEVWK